MKSLMRWIAAAPALVALVVATPAFSFSDVYDDIDTMAGTMLWAADGYTTCYAYASGNVTAVEDTVPTGNVRCYIRGGSEVGAFPLQNCVAEPIRWKVVNHDTGGWMMYDEDATITLSRVNWYVTGAVLSGNDGISPYTVTISDPFQDEYGRKMFHWTMVRQIAQPGGTTPMSDDPPILRPGR